MAIVAAPPPSPAAVALVRRFNRFYTQRIGALDPHHLASPFSLTEVRVLYEIAHASAITAAEIAARLGLDPGYLSRILARFAGKRLVARSRSSDDGRRTLLAMTPKGRAVLAPLEAKASGAVAELIAPLAGAERERVLSAMRTIEVGLAGERRAGGFALRGPRPGDMGWVIERHGSLYAEERGYDERFEALVAEVVLAFMRGHDPRRERCWIADEDGVRLGSIFLVAKSPEVAKLRLLLVEPSARGRGLGKALVDECVGFARRAGYRRVTLWTNSELHAARRVYEAVGFTLVSEEPHELFTDGSLGQTWDLAL